MAESMFVSGDDAIGWGALNADCFAFFGYPITPQNEVAEWFSREFPKRGKVFLQTVSETSVSNMLFGAAASGVRVMTSTSGPGWSLMQEAISHMVNAELPCVIVLVQRGGPGGGTTRHAQMDYFSATRGGGHGGYRTIVLAPASVQETHDLMQLAFYLADKYRNPTVVLSDGMIVRLAERMEFRRIDFGPLPEKDWAVKGYGQYADGKRRRITMASGLAQAPPHPDYLSLLSHLDRKCRLMSDTEVRCEGHRLEDAELVLVAYGYMARICEEALNMARAQGHKVGLIRPITLWPFPRQIIGDTAKRGCKFLVVEDSLGLMIEDVEAAVKGQAEVHLLGVFARHTRKEIGVIFPERVVEEIAKLL